MVQTTSVITETDISPLCLTSLYSPPRYSIKAEDYKDLFNLTAEKFIIGGDFNAKHTHWGSRLITPKGIWM